MRRSELALVKIYRTTGQEKYLDFANWLLEERGHGHGSMGGEGKWDPAYYQDVIPVRELTDISGACRPLHVPVLRDGRCGSLKKRHRLCRGFEPPTGRRSTT